MYLGVIMVKLVNVPWWSRRILSLLDPEMEGVLVMMGGVGGTS